MASQSEAERWRQQELALTAVEHRLQALGEYLAVYRASYASSGEGRHYARVRMLRKDIGRLRAWWWYLQATRRGASWLPLLERVVGLLAVFVSPVRRGGSRRHSSGMLRHLSSHSLIERAYAALEDDLQRQLLTLRLAQYQRPTDSRGREINMLQRQLEEVAVLRASGLPEPRRLTAICHVLHRVMTVRQWLGLQLPLANLVDR
ncbi:hypothetical protein [Alcanivorax jadensis]|uniref:hypothetical protein n=1 Tax=Alcanivorax jadensis TaxID=64988 RepID=UPI003566B479